MCIIITEFPELKNTTIETKNSLERFKSRLNQSEESPNMKTGHWKSLTLRSKKPTKLFKKKGEGAKHKGLMGSQKVNQESILGVLEEVSEKRAESLLEEIMAKNFIDLRGTNGYTNTRS